ncbi:MAG: hypothetical protein J5482_02015 [Oscillospiraceae bacterium]|nr:hypothetical protein [Oscillospiraceae bacterium]
MADQRRRPGTTVYGNLAYDLDALVRERNLDEAGKMAERERRVQPQPQRRAVAAPRPRTAFSPVLVLAAAVLAAMVILLLGNYVQMTAISANVSQLKKDLAALDDEHVSLLTKYEQTFDLETVKAAAEAAGMSKPTSAQIEYIDLGGMDTAVVYQAGAGGLLGDLADSVVRGFSALVEYFR